MNAKIRGQKLANRILTQPQSITSPPSKICVDYKGEPGKFTVELPGRHHLDQGIQVHIASGG